MPQTSPPPQPGDTAAWVSLAKAYLAKNIDPKLADRIVDEAVAMNAVPKGHNGLPTVAEKPSAMAKKFGLNNLCAEEVYNAVTGLATALSNPSNLSITTTGDNVVKAVQSAVCGR